ncbi:hypothetical protein B0T14DRAFT_496166 [Immersiella caudata]|uniref:Uncharacterized protein n=1 Tax=Immersiella caudata TaxID=314043 RepID=A0AA39WPX3_9PEZI|nr:hypothetical protein B0T14DRAFT_496166 [Immersiella caudata]
MLSSTVGLFLFALQGVVAKPNPTPTAVTQMTTFQTRIVTYPYPPYPASTLLASPAPFQTAMTRPKDKEGNYIPWYKISTCTGANHRDCKTQIGGDMFILPSAAPHPAQQDETLPTPEGHSEAVVIPAGQVDANPSRQTRIPVPFLPPPPPPVWGTNPPVQV